MKYLLSLGVIIIITTGCASVMPKTPITVVGSGATYNEAVDAAKKAAVQKEVGIQLLSRRELRNEVIVLDSSIEYSAGYIDTVTVNSVTYSNNRYSANITAVVSSSKINMAILQYSTTSTKFNGVAVEQHYAKVESVNQQSNNLSTWTMQDYPKKAYNITTDKITTSRKNTKIDYTIQWNESFSRGLVDTVKSISTDKKFNGAHAVHVLNTSSVWKSRENYYTSNGTAISKINSAMLSTLTLVVEFKRYGTTLYKECYPLIFHSLNSEKLRQQYPVFYGFIFDTGLTHKSSATVALPPNLEYNQITDVSLSIDNIHHLQCK